MLLLSVHVHLLKMRIKLDHLYCHINSTVHNWNVYQLIDFSAGTCTILPLFWK